MNEELKQEAVRRFTKVLIRLIAILIVTCAFMFYLQDNVAYGTIVGLLGVAGLIIVGKTGVSWLKELDVDWEEEI